MSNLTILLMLLIPAAITFLLRLAPFLMFGRRRQMSSLVEYLGETLPYTVMAALVVYCLKGLRTGISCENTAATAAVVVVTVMHLWKKNTILSITVGTVCYMALLRILC